MEINNIFKDLKIDVDRLNKPQQFRFGVSCENLKPLEKDTVSFSETTNSKEKQKTNKTKPQKTIFKKSDFEGTDFAVIEKFKPNIQQFKKKEDLQTFAKKEIEKLQKKDFGGRKEEIIIQRKAMLQEWFDYVIKQNDTYSNTQKLIILSSIVKDLDDTNDKLPPVLNKGVLADAVTALDEKLKVNSKTNFNFHKIYQTKMNEYYLEETNTGLTSTGWIVIPSKKHDFKNFEKNVDKLKTLSYKSWCTKSYNAEPYLKKGDFHVYLENGQPKIGIRFVGNKIQEIQGEKNNTVIPQDYFDIVKTHIKNEKLKLSSTAQEEIKEAEKTKEFIAKAKADLAQAIKENDVETILKYFGIKVLEKDKDGFLTIQDYVIKTKDNITFEEVGIDENKLFEKIKRVEGELKIHNTNIKSLGALEFVNRLYTYIEKGHIVKAPNLKEVNSLWTLNNIEQEQEFLKNLEKINTFDIKAFEKAINEEIRNGKFNAEKIFNLCGIQTEKDEDGSLIISKYRQPNEHFSFACFGIDENKLLEKVKKVKGNVVVDNCSNLTSLQNIEEIDGKLVIYNDSKINKLDKVKKIGGDLSIYNLNLESLGDLEYIGGSAWLINLKKLQTLGKLKKVEKSLRLTSSSVSDLGDLEYIGEDAWFNFSKIKDLGKLKHVGGDIYTYKSDIKYKDIYPIHRNQPKIFYLLSKLWYVPVDRNP